MLHPVGRRLDGLDPELVQGRGLHLQGRLGCRPQPLPHPVVEGAALLAAARRPARSPSCAAPTRRAGTIKSGGATRRAAKMVVLDVDHPDIEEFVETKAREEDKIRALRDAGFDMDLGGADITSVQYQNANNSVRVSDEFMRAVEDGTSFGLRARKTARGHRDRRRPRAVPQDQQGRVGVRRPGSAVRRHDQRLAHQPRDRPDHRVQPVLGVHVARQLVVQPRVAQPAEVPQGRRHLRRGAVPEGRRGHHHRDGHLDLLRRLPDRGDRHDHPRLPPARHRLRQPRCAADGDGSGLRLRRRPLDGRGADVADDRRVVPAECGARRDRRPVRRLRPQRRGPQPRDAQAPGGQRRRPHRPPRGRPRAQAGHPGVGRRRRARQDQRLPQRAGLGARPDRDHRLHDGLRHHRHRARLLAGEVQEAGRRRLDADREPDDPAGAEEARVRRGEDRGDRRLHRRARPRDRRAGSEDRALRDLRHRDGRPRPGADGPRPDDGGRASRSCPARSARR